MLTVLLLKGCLQNGALQAKLDESLAKLSKVQESLKATENERDESRVELSLSEAELKSQRMAAESVNGSQTELKQLHLGRLIQFADFVADNPAMTRRVLQEADAFAKKWALDDRPFTAHLTLARSDGRREGPVAARELAAVLRPAGHDRTWPELDRAMWNVHPRSHAQGQFYVVPGRKLV